MFDEGRLTSDLVMAQGTRIGRDGRVFIRRDQKNPGRVVIGGHSQVLVDGELSL